MRSVSVVSGNWTPGASSSVCMLSTSLAHVTKYQVYVLLLWASHGTFSQKSTVSDTLTIARKLEKLTPRQLRVQQYSFRFFIFCHGWTGGIGNLESKIKDFAVCRILRHYNTCYSIFTSSAKISLQKTHARYHTLAARQNECHPQESRRLKNPECEMGQLNSWPLIAYVLPTDQLAAKKPSKY